jgi:hypothetical protein
MPKKSIALLDLENKYVNIDTDLSLTSIHDTAVLKRQSYSKNLVQNSYTFLHLHFIYYVFYCFYLKVL